MACDPCTQAKANPAHPHFTPKCLHCGARIIQRLGLLPISASECTTRRRAMLAVWVDYGHPEAAIRALVAGESLPIAPDCDKKPPPPTLARAHGLPALSPSPGSSSGPGSGPVNLPAYVHRTKTKRR